MFGSSPSIWPVTFTASPMRLNWTCPLIFESWSIGTIAARSFIAGAMSRGGAEGAEVESSTVPVEVSTVWADAVERATVKAAVRKR